MRLQPLMLGKTSFAVRFMQAAKQLCCKYPSLFVGIMNISVLK
jgi:hypothetical protein